MSWKLLQVLPDCTFLKVVIQHFITLVPQRSMHPF